MTMRFAEPAARSLGLRFGGLKESPGRSRWYGVHARQGHTSRGRDVELPAASGPTSGQKFIEKVWREFFLDPSEWWDHRFDKASASYPDFKHKKTQQPLWVDGRLTPSWVAGELAALEQGSVQMSIFSWNSALVRSVKDGLYEKTLQLYQKMQEEGVNPNMFTYIPVLNACASLRSLDEGKRIHAQIVRSGSVTDVFVWNSLIDMYAKCRSIEDAWVAFNEMPERDVVSWNSMIVGCVKCGLISAARSLFDKMPTRDVVSWSAMIGAYPKVGQGQESLKLFRDMKKELVEPNSVTFLGVVNACACVGALEEGSRIHAQIIDNLGEPNVFVGSGLIDMYSKCGSIENALEVFNKMSTRDVVSWNSMLGAYASYGLGKEAIQLFERMCQDGVKCSRATFVLLLSACSHGGLFDEGVRYFESMSSVYGILPAVEHYAWLVDLHGRAGLVQEAESVIKTMPIEPNVVVWRALLGVCRAHGNVELGERIAKRLIECDPKSASGYVLLSNIYAAAGQLERRAEIQLRKENNANKESVCTWIEVKGQVHSFVVDDQVHPQKQEIYEKLNGLSEEMKKEGYVQDTGLVLHDVEEECKVHSLWRHSEKLAIAFGLMSTPPATPIRILKYTHVCRDCHTFIKFMSKLVGREIFLRDVNLCHQFKDGHCSCKDYW